MPVPDQPKIYHIVHVDRLPSVIAEGNLLCDAEIVLQRDKQAENPASIRMRTRGWGLVGRA